MGYNTDFDGYIEVDPPLNEKEIEFLKDFNATRRIDRGDGDPYYINDDLDIIGMEGYNSPVEGQPGLYCQWVPSEDGSKIIWDDGESFQNSELWMKYIVDHFIGSKPIAKDNGLEFFEGHVLSGTILANGDERDDNWAVAVRNDMVFTRTMSLSYNGSDIIEVTNGSTEVTNDNNSPSATMVL